MPVANAGLIRQSGQGQIVVRYMRHLSAYKNHFTNKIRQKVFNVQGTWWRAGGQSREIIEMSTP